MATSPSKISLEHSIAPFVPAYDLLPALSEDEVSAIGLALYMSLPKVELLESAWLAQGKQSQLRFGLTK